ncbi:unnamed protein product, partial [Effrenium voratum]
FGAAPPSPPAPARVALRAVRGGRGAAEQVAAKPAPAPAWRGASNGSAPEKPCWYQEEATRGTGMTWSFGPPLRLRMRLAGFGALGLEVANTGRKSGARVEVALAGHALPSIAPGETCHLVLAFRDLELGAASLELLDLRSQVQVFAHHCPKKVEGPPLEVLGLAGLTPLCREGQQVWVGWSGCSASGHDWRLGRVAEVLSSSKAWVQLPEERLLVPAWQLLPADNRSELDDLDSTVQRCPAFAQSKVE